MSDIILGVGGITPSLNRDVTSVSLTSAGTKTTIGTIQCSAAATGTITTTLPFTATPTSVQSGSSVSLLALENTTSSARTGTLTITRSSDSNTPAFYPAGTTWEVDLTQLAGTGSTPTPTTTYYWGVKLYVKTNSSTVMSGNYKIAFGMSTTDTTPTPTATSSTITTASTFVMSDTFWTTTSSTAPTSLGTLYLHPVLANGTSASLHTIYLSSVSATATETIKDYSILLNTTSTVDLDSLVTACSLKWAKDSTYYSYISILCTLATD